MIRKTKLYLKSVKMNYIQPLNQRLICIKWRLTPKFIVLNHFSINLPSHWRNISSSEYHYNQWCTVTCSYLAQANPNIAATCKIQAFHFCDSKMLSQTRVIYSWYLGSKLRYWVSPNCALTSSKTLLIHLFYFLTNFLPCEQF